MHIRFGIWNMSCVCRSGSLKRKSHFEDLDIIVLIIVKWVLEVENEML